MKVRYIVPNTSPPAARYRDTFTALSLSIHHGQLTDSVAF